MRTANSCPMCRLELFPSETLDEDDDGTVHTEDFEDDSDSEDEEEEQEENAQEVITQDTDATAAVEEPENLYTPNIMDAPEVTVEMVAERFQRENIGLVQLLALVHTSLECADPRFSNKRKRRQMEEYLEEMMDEMDRELVDNYLMGFEDRRSNVMVVA